MGAEEKLFVLHSQEEQERQLEVMRGTMTDDCICDLKNTGERWQGWDGAVRFYEIFLDAFSGMEWVGERVRLEWGVYFPWNPDQKKFESETF